ncbi:hypothetical protein Bbelb_168350 [Branchiostoma belcheri]|nr:hypothetical protein Bbelb_168350 [Branchiostoma belcheri]
MFGHGFAGVCGTWTRCEEFATTNDCRSGRKLTRMEPRLAKESPPRLKSSRYVADENYLQPKDSSTFDLEREELNPRWRTGRHFPSFREATKGAGHLFEHVPVSSSNRKDETLPRVEDVRNFVETLVGNAVKNLEAEPLDGPRRDALFEKGLQYQNRGRLEYALKCYLGCLKDLDQTEGFSKLPHCLHQVCGSEGKGQYCRGQRARL